MVLLHLLQLLRLHAVFRGGGGGGGGVKLIADAVAVAFVLCIVADSVGCTPAATAACATADGSF